MKQLTLLTLLLLFLCTVARGQQSADLILHNGVIWTVDDKKPSVQAVAIRDAKFVVVGSNAAALKLRGPATRVIDLRGHFVVPGFNDNHVHFASAAQFLEFNIMRASTQQQFVDRVKEVISRLPKGEWIVGGFWGAYDEWASGSAGNQKREPFAPDMSLVNEITNDYPMFIRKFDDTQFAANQAAFRALKLELHRTGDLSVRIHFRPGLDRWKELADRSIRVGSGDEWIRLGALKGHIDGIMGTSTARFFDPYSNDPKNRGRWRPLMVNDKGEFVEGKFLGYMLDADRAGLQLTVHAIGDEANNVLLNYLEELNKQNGKRDRRFRLVHAQVLAPADFKRLGQLGVVAEVQPFHLSDDMRWMEERIGADRTRGAYAFKSIQASGAVLSFGTDWPGTSASEYPINPMLGLYAAVTRQTITGRPVEGWFPNERISIAEAIKAYTYNTAYANFEETTKGSIEVGKFADLTVLSQNLLKIAPKEYLTTDVVYTVVGGKIVYARD